MIFRKLKYIFQKHKNYLSCNVKFLDCEIKNNSDPSINAKPKINV